MKRFACGDVVPGCTARFEAKTEEEMLQLVAVHAKYDHAMPAVPTDVVEAVRAQIHTVDHA